MTNKISNISKINKTFIILNLVIFAIFKFDKIRIQIMYTIKICILRNNRNFYFSKIPNHNIGDKNIMLYKQYRVV